MPTLTAFLDAGDRRRRPRRARAGATWSCANNVYAHIPDVVGFTKGLRALVADDGWVSIEVQHLLTLIERNQYDTIYHEHFQYYTVLTAQRALASGGLALVDVELLRHARRLDPAVGARPARGGRRAVARRPDVLAAEKAAGLHTVDGHAEFAAAVSPGARRPAARSCIDARRRRQDGRRLRRAGQGQHPAQPLRHPARPARVHGRPQPVQARPVHPGHPDPDPRRPSGSPPTGRTTCWSCRGTCAPS